MTTIPRHFLDLDLIDKAELRSILDAAVQYKATRKARQNGGERSQLAGCFFAVIMEMPSTRTRISFEIAIRELGGDVTMLSGAMTQLSRGESYADTGRVLSRYLDGIVIRTDSADKLQELADHATIPVINGLTDRSHPCQIMADVMTFEEHRGSIQGKVIAWMGDGNNVARSWIHAALQFGFELRIACPSELAPPAGLIESATRQGAKVTLSHDAMEAVQGVDGIVTDAWVSMTDKDAPNRYNILAPYRVDTDLLSKASPEAVVMHCLPAYRGHEITTEVLDGPQSIVLDEAENRLHVQKAILHWCMKNGG